MLVVALYDSYKEGIDELEIRKGDVICVLKRQRDDWWYGYHISDPAKRGLFPSNYVRMEAAHTNGNQGREDKQASTSSTEGSRLDGDLMDRKRIRSRTKIHMAQMSKNLAATRIALFYRRIRSRKDLQLRCVARQTIQRLSRKQTSNRFGIINSRQRDRISLRQLDAALQLQRWVRNILDSRREISRRTENKVWKTGRNSLTVDEMNCRLDEVERRLYEGENREARYHIIGKKRTLEVETINNRIACIEIKIMNLEHLQKSTSDDLEKRLSVMEEVFSKIPSYIFKQPQQLAQSNERFISLDKKVLLLESRLNNILINATQPIAPSDTTQTYLPRLPSKPSRLKLPVTRKSSLRS